MRCETCSLNGEDDGEVVGKRFECGMVAGGGWQVAGGRWRVRKKRGATETRDKEVCFGIRSEKLVQRKSQLDYHRLRTLVLDIDSSLAVLHRTRIDKQDGEAKLDEQRSTST
jgi:hypothetical protein